MIDTITNLLFRCSHRRLTRPVTPVSKAGAPHEGAYVVCLDCGKQFAYDTTLMKLGKVIHRSEDAGVLPANMPHAKQSKLKVALWASAVPLGILIGSALGKKNAHPEKADEPANHPPVPTKQR
jgi:DNA-directed RNA polymerase subunit RPC12/RpoP